MAPFQRDSFKSCTRPGAAGAVAEWSKALAWKVSIRQNRIEGSNPSRSANQSSCWENTCRVHDKFPGFAPISRETRYEGEVRRGLQMLAESGFSPRAFFTLPLCYAARQATRR